MTPHNGEYGDLYKLGIIDPTKVVRIALQDAASVASLDHDRSDGRGEAEEGNPAAGDAGWRNGLLIRGFSQSPVDARRPAGVFSWRPRSVSRKGFSVVRRECAAGVTGSFNRTLLQQPSCGSRGLGLSPKCDSDAPSYN